MDPDRVNIRTLLRRFKNCLTCPCVTTDSESEERERIYGVTTDSNSEEDEEQSLSGLHLVAALGDTEAVSSIISTVNINVKDHKRNTPLHYASHNGHVDVVDLLLGNNANVDIKNVSGQTSLHLAAKRGYVNIVQILIVNGANVNSCNKAKLTALHLACQNGHTSIVEILLDNHATVDIMKQSEETPFYLAVKYGHAEVTDLLLGRGICDFVLTRIKETPLHVAVKRGHIEVVEVILKHSSRISGELINCQQIHKEITNDLIKASGILQIQFLRCCGQRISAGIVWSEECKPLEIWEDEYGRTALDIGVVSNQPKMVKLLLDADKGTYSDGHLTSGFHSLRQSRMYNILTDCRSNIEVAEDYEMFFKTFKEIAQALIGSSKFNVNHQNEIGEAPIYDVITDMVNVHGTPGNMIHMIYLIQLLLENGANVNLKNYAEETPLMIASKRGCCYAIQTLFDWEQQSGMKVDLDARDRYGETALMKAVANVERCHDITLQSNWVHSSEVELHIDARDRYGATPFIKAAEKGHMTVMRLLLNHKASVNLVDYYGLTALHSAVYERKRNWFDIQFFCKDFRNQNINGASISLEKSSRKQLQLRRKIMNSHRLIDWLQTHIEFTEETILCNGDALKHMRRGIEDPPIVLLQLLSNLRLTLEAVNLLLDDDRTIANAIDIRGYTPLDLAIGSVMESNSMSMKSTENCEAFRKFQEAPLEVAQVDNRGRNPLHRLIISGTSDCLSDLPTNEQLDDNGQFDLMVKGILLNPENFNELATATDNKGRIPLHYAAMSPLIHCSSECKDRIKMLLDMGSKIDTADIYGKTPLHYAEEDTQYKVLIHFGADKNAKDNFGNKPRYLKRLRDNNDKAGFWLYTELYSSADIAKVVKTDHGTKLNMRKQVETIRIYSQSPRCKESSEKTIWKIWTENNFIRLNRRLSQLKPSVKHFIERLADGIKEKDERFECQTTLVGSAEEETKAVISADFDFNFKLVKFSHLCTPFPHPLGPKGYFELRRKTSEGRDSRSGEMFGSFFTLDHCLLTDEVNSRFKIILEEVLSDPDLWQTEHHFDWHMKHRYSSRYRNHSGKCTTIRLRLLNPIDDGEGEFIFLNISVDITACVNVENWWPEDALPVDISPAEKTDGCTFVFRRPNFRLWKPCSSHSMLSKTFARISFAPLECRIVKESAPLAKTAYMVCKMILYYNPGTTYQLKTCLLFCMEALNTRNGNETRVEDKVTRKQLAFWVERIMFCFMEFSRHHVFPCYFMPSFRQEVKHIGDGHIETRRYGKVDKDLIPFSYCESYDLYLYLCPDDTVIDIPVQHSKHQNKNINRGPNNDPFWEQFEREDFIRLLTSCISH